MTLSLGSLLGDIQSSHQLLKLALALLTAVTAVAKGLPALANANRRHQGTREASVAPVRLWEMASKPESLPWPDSLEERFVDPHVRKKSNKRSKAMCRTLLFVCIVVAAAASGTLVAVRPPLWEVWVALTATLASLGVAWLRAALQRLKRDETKPTPGIEHSGEVVLVGTLDDIRQAVLFNLVHHVGARVVSVRQRDILALSGLALPHKLALGARLAVTLQPNSKAGTVRVAIVSTKLDYVLPGNGRTAVSWFVQSWAATMPATSVGEVEAGRRTTTNGRGLLLSRRGL